MSDSTENDLIISEQPFEVHLGDEILTLPCRVTLKLAGSPKLNIETLEMIEMQAGHMGLDRDYKIRIIPNAAPIDVLAVSAPHSFGEKSGISFRFTPTSQPVFVDGGGQLVSVRFGLVNFGVFYVQAQNQPGLLKNRIVLSWRDWRVEVTPDVRGILGDVSKAEDPFYRITQAATLRKIDNSEFSCSEAHKFFDSFSVFLSFCRGRWVAPVLVTGVDEQGVTQMQEWGIRRIEPYTQSGTWLDRMHGIAIGEVFPGFMERFADQEWEDAIHTAVYWYTRTNGTSAGADGSVILVQAALERLSWDLLVRRRRTISEGGFEKLPAADKVRLLLSTLLIPLEIPKTLSAITQAAKEFNWPDAPQAFVEIRNRLVHPPKRNQSSTDLPVFEGWLLGQWYLELALLRLFGFKGQYSNRTKMPLYPAQVDPVPWDVAAGPV